MIYTNEYLLSHIVPDLNLKPSPSTVKALNEHFDKLSVYQLLAMLKTQLNALETTYVSGHDKQQCLIAPFDLKDVRLLMVFEVSDMQGQLLKAAEPLQNLLDYNPPTKVNQSISIFKSEAEKIADEADKRRTNELEKKRTECIGILKPAFKARWERIRQIQLQGQQSKHFLFETLEKRFAAIGLIVYALDRKNSLMWSNEPLSILQPTGMISLNTAGKALTAAELLKPLHNLAINLATKAFNPELTLLGVRKKVNQAEDWTISLQDFAQFYQVLWAKKADDKPENDSELQALILELRTSTVAERWAFQAEQNAIEKVRKSLPLVKEEGRWVEVATELSSEADFSLERLKADLVHMHRIIKMYGQGSMLPYDVYNNSKKSEILGFGKFLKFMYLEMQAMLQLQDSWLQIDYSSPEKLELQWQGLLDACLPCLARQQWLIITAELQAKFGESELTAAVFVYMTSKINSQWPNANALSEEIDAIASEVRKAGQSAQVKSRWEKFIRIYSQAAAKAQLQQISASLTSLRNSQLTATAVDIPTEAMLQALQQKIAYAHDDGILQQYFTALQPKIRLMQDAITQNVTYKNPHSLKNRCDVLISHYEQNLSAADAANIPGQLQQLVEAHQEMARNNLSATMGLLQKLKQQIDALKLAGNSNEILQKAFACIELSALAGEGTPGFFVLVIKELFIATANNPGLQTVHKILKDFLGLNAPDSIKNCEALLQAGLAEYWFSEMIKRKIFATGVEVKPTLAAEDEQLLSSNTELSDADKLAIRHIRVAYSHRSETLAQLLAYDKDKLKLILACAMLDYLATQQLKDFDQASKLKAQLSYFNKIQLWLYSVGLDATHDRMKNIGADRLPTAEAIYASYVFQQQPLTAMHNLQLQFAPLDKEDNSGRFAANQIVAQCELVQPCNEWIDRIKLLAEKGLLDDTLAEKVILQLKEVARTNAAEGFWENLSKLKHLFISAPIHYWEKVVEAVEAKDAKLGNTVAVDKPFLVKLSRTAKSLSAFANEVLDAVVKGSAVDSGRVSEQCDDLKKYVKDYAAEEGLDKATKDLDAFETNVQAIYTPRANDIRSEQVVTFRRDYIQDKLNKRIATLKTKVYANAEEAEEKAKAYNDFIQFHFGPFKIFTTYGEDGKVIPSPVENFLLFVNDKLLSLNSDVTKYHHFWQRLFKQRTQDKFDELETKLQDCLQQLIEEQPTDIIHVAKIFYPLNEAFAMHRSLLHWGQPKSYDEFMRQYFCFVDDRSYALMFAQDELKRLQSRTQWFFNDRRDDKILKLQAFIDDIKKNSDNTKYFVSMSLRLQTICAINTGFSRFWKKSTVASNNLQEAVAHYRNYAPVPGTGPAATAQATQQQLAYCSQLVELELTRVADSKPKFLGTKKHDVKIAALQQVATDINAEKTVTAIRTELKAACEISRGYFALWTTGSNNYAAADTYYKRFNRKRMDAANKLKSADDDDTGFSLRRSSSRHSKRQ